MSSDAAVAGRWREGVEGATATAFTGLHKGDHVRVHPRAPQYQGQRGVVHLVPKHPVTWFKVAFPDGAIGTFRSSNLIPLCPTTGNALPTNHHHSGKGPSSRSGKNSQADHDLMDVTSEDNDDEDDEDAPTKPLRKRRAPVNIIKQYAVQPSAPSIPGCFSASGNCTTCGVQAWVAAKFCWNENCETSPIYFALPGCRGAAAAAAAPLSCVDDAAAAEKATSTALFLSAERSRSTRSDSLTDSEVGSINSTATSQLSSQPPRTLI